jgi:galactoside O-acetyltransferase
MSFLTIKQLENMGFAYLGENVLISDKCSIYNPSKIKIASNVRVDDFCILSAGNGGIEIGNNVHIACYVSIIGSESIKIGNYVGISSKTAVYSSSDDYSGNFLTGPTILDKYKNVDNRPVIFEDHVLLGALCLVLPGVTIKEGAAIGSFSFISKNVEPWGMYAGNPLRFLKERSKKMLNFLDISLD